LERSSPSTKFRAICSASYEGMPQVADPLDVQQAFPGWRRPLLVPERRQLKNPFTGEPIFNADGTPFIVTTSRPLGPWNERPRCPRLVDFSPVNLWPVPAVAVGLLGKSLGAAEPRETEEALFAPEHFGWSLCVMSEASVRVLAAVPCVAGAIEIWHNALRDTHEAYFAELLADVSDWTTVVEHLVRLSRVALDARWRLYVYEGPDPTMFHSP
jgi:hypothetical protein